MGNIPPIAIKTLSAFVPDKFDIASIIKIKNDPYALHMMIQKTVDDFQKLLEQDRAYGVDTSSTGRTDAAEGVKGVSSGDDRDGEKHAG